MSEDWDGFAHDWIAAWNARDPDRILPHYAEALEFESPMVRKLGHSPDGRLTGMAPFAAYVAEALMRAPDLSFDLIAATRGMNGGCVIYRGVGGRLVAEQMQRDPSGKIVSAQVFYGR